MVEESIVYLCRLKRREELGLSDLMRSSVRSCVCNVKPIAQLEFHVLHSFVLATTASYCLVQCLFTMLLLLLLSCLLLCSDVAESKVLTDDRRESTRLGCLKGEDGEERLNNWLLPNLVIYGTRRQPATI